MTRHVFSFFYIGALLAAIFLQLEWWPLTSNSLYSNSMRYEEARMIRAVVSGRRECEASFVLPVQFSVIAMRGHTWRPAASKYALGKLPVECRDQKMDLSLIKVMREPSGHFLAMVDTDEPSR